MINAPGRPRVATNNPLQPEPYSRESAMLKYRLLGIVRTGRVKTAKSVGVASTVPAVIGRKGGLVEADEFNDAVAHGEVGLEG